MASSTKRAWKLQEFVAHGASVNCLALGHKSGRVLVTGGDDKKVNLWAVGKPNCIMSLCGHTTPVECVRFGQTEELVCAGSQSGALKIWDLGAARLVRTLTGHKSNIRCIDFHPYGDFLSSGSLDTNLKLWDIRRKGCIFTYKGHSECINSLKFSPDGQWIASAGEEGAVKIWDLRAGKLMTEFNNHSGPVHDVEFHPHEFLLASASQDRTVNFWDLESFQLVSTSERDSGPVRCITFHPEGDCVFSGSHDSLKVHGWEPPRICDSLLMGWGKIRDLAIASTQLVGAAYQMSNVSIYVVDLKRVEPFGVNPRAVAGGQPAGQPFKAGQHVRRSFIKEKPDANGTRPSPQVKISEEGSDKSGTDPDDSDTYSTADINDYHHYESIFRPRRRELARTPPPNEEDEPFPAPATSDIESNLSGPTRPDPKHKRPSPSPTRRASQPAFPSGFHSSPDLNNRNSISAMTRTRRTSSTAQQRPLSVYDQPIQYADQGPRTQVHLGGTPQQQRELQSPTNRYQRSTSVQPRSTTNHLDYPRGDPSLDARSTSLTRPASKPDFTQLTPVSRIHLNGSDRPLDRPTLVRPTRSSVQLSTMDSPSPEPIPQQQVVRQPPSQPQYANSSPQRLKRPSQPDLSLQLRSTGSAVPPNRFGQTKQLTSSGDSTPEKEKLDVVPMNPDKPSGLAMEDFLPKKFQSLSMYEQPMSKFNYNGFKPEPSESEVTNSILKGHESMMAVLTSRGRNLEIIQKLWHGKDAMTAVEHAVSLKDQSVMVDLLQVIVLRPSIWNLDLCVSLLPPIGELLQSKYELYISAGCGAMKLILKNFASVIKSNIDSPVQTVGVDISREERHNKCMQCYKDLVKIRSLILKRQTMQGKLGHTFRELSILMQYLD